jgi:hypothetical protein
MPTLTEICNAIETTLGAAVTHSQAFDEITEAMTDAPMLQVYPEEGLMDERGGSDRRTFKGGVRVERITIFADYYAKQRGAGIGEEMGVLVPGIDALMDIFKAQDTKPYFGLEGLEAFGAVNWRRVIFEYGEGKFIGARFTIPVTRW